MNFRIFIRIFYNNSRVDDVFLRKKKIEYILSAITFINIANRIFSPRFINSQWTLLDEYFCQHSSLRGCFPYWFTSCRIFRANLTFLECYSANEKTTISISISKDLNSRSIVFHFKRFFLLLFLSESLLIGKKYDLILNMQISSLLI